MSYKMDKEDDAGRAASSSPSGQQEWTKTRSIDFGEVLQEQGEAHGPNYDSDDGWVASNSSNSALVAASMIFCPVIWSWVHTMRPITLREAFTIWSRFEKELDLVGREVPAIVGNWVYPSPSAAERMQDAAGPYAGEITSVVEEEERAVVKVKWFLNSREGGPYSIPNRWETESAQDFELMAADAKLTKKTMRFQERIVQDEYDSKIKSIRLAGRWQSLQAAWVDHCKVLLDEELSLIRADILKLKEQRALEEEMKKAEAQSHAAKHVVALKGGMRGNMIRIRKEKAEREEAERAKREEEERKRLEREAQKAEIRARQMSLLEAQGLYRRRNYKVTVPRKLGAATKYPLIDVAAQWPDPDLVCCRKLERRELDIIPHDHIERRYKGHIWMVCQHKDTSPNQVYKAVPLTWVLRSDAASQILVRRVTGREEFIKIMEAIEMGIERGDGRMRPLVHSRRPLGDLYEWLCPGAVEEYEAPEIVPGGGVDLTSLVLLRVSCEGTQRCQALLDVMMHWNSSIKSLVGVENSFGDDGVEMIAAAMSGRYVDVLFKRANDVTHVSGIRAGEESKVKFTEEEELAFEALAEESRLRRLTSEQREEEEMQKRKEEEEKDLMSSGDDDDDDDYTDEEQAAEWIDAHEDFERVASEEARGDVLSEERGGGEGLHDDVKKEGGDVRLYTKRVEEERKRLREVYHMKRVEEREAMRKEKRERKRAASKQRKRANALEVRRLKRAQQKADAISAYGPVQAAFGFGIQMSLPLSHLALHNNGIGSVGAGHLARSLKDNSTLISLDISNNHISTDGGKAMASALEVNTCLRDLNLQSNGIDVETEGVLALCARRRPIGETEGPNARFTDGFPAFRLTIGRRGKPVFVSPLPTRSQESFEHLPRALSKAQNLSRKSAHDVSGQSTSFWGRSSARSGGAVKNQGGSFACLKREMKKEPADIVMLSVYEKQDLGLMEWQEAGEHLLGIDSVNSLHRAPSRRDAVRPTSSPTVSRRKVLPQKPARVMGSFRNPHVDREYGTSPIPQFEWSDESDAQDSVPATSPVAGLSGRSRVGQSSPLRSLAPASPPPRLPKSSPGPRISKRSGKAPPILVPSAATPSSAKGVKPPPTPSQRVKSFIKGKAGNASPRGRSLVSPTGSAASSPIGGVAAGRGGVPPLKPFKTCPNPPRSASAAESRNKSKHGSSAWSIPNSKSGGVAVHSADGIQRSGSGGSVTGWKKNPAFRDSQGSIDTSLSDLVAASLVRTEFAEAAQGAGGNEEDGGSGGREGKQYRYQGSMGLAFILGKDPKP